MRKAFAISLLAALAFAGCQVNEIIEEVSESKSFTATIEDNFGGAETRTSLDENGNVRWKQGDQVSIFAGSTVNEQYQVTDASDGKTSAGFNKVSGSGFVGGSEIDNNVAFYPYAASAEIARNGSAYVISDITLPATQTYVAGSFGNGAFPMAAVTSTTDDMHLKFKNVLGGLKLQLKGTATITAISVTGNNNEILCGAAEVTVSNSTTPSINLTDATAKTVTLDCGEGVQLNSETATLFIIALPPMTMEGGFTVVVTDTEGKQMEIKTTKSQTINRSKLLKMPAVTYEGTSKFSPLTFTSTGETSIALVKSGSPDDVSLEYSLNGGAWTSYSVGDAIALADGENVSFRAGANGNISLCEDLNCHKFTVSGSGTVAASGSIMSLLNQEESLAIPSSYCFARLFQGCTSLTTAPELPATTLANYCYYRMFDGCTKLAIAPELPARTLADYCYSTMFFGCTSLTTAPELPVKTLARGCYYFMFYDCTGLTTPPILPATTMAEKCYCGMFSHCTGLTAAPKLPATALAPYCYDSMFAGCTSLTTAPALPARTLKGNCYDSMFQNCTSLTTAPGLPATTLVEACYMSMFQGCISLTTAPDLPATTLAGRCYCDMFSGCTKLATAPDLPATTLAEYCYTSMFKDCSITTAPDLLATTLARYCYYYMFNGCTSLTTAPELPATTLAPTCYGYMFQGCTSLTSAPDLPATILAGSCYVCMFHGCTDLTSAPDLPATTLAKYCYCQMFYECANLNYIKCLATDITATDCLSNWVYGVSSSGVFIKDPDTTWPTGYSGIPSGWTVYPTGLPAEVEAVDLGLPSGLKWASCNVDANSPEEYGDYFAWGEMEPKADYSWETYKWCKGSYTTLTKYNTNSSYGTVVDSETVLDPEDDAAHVNWGGSWRMPTDEDWTELRTKCSWSWISQNGVNGRKVTGPNGNSIFLPAAGGRYDTNLYDMGSRGYYWSSSLNTDYPSGAWYVYFDSGDVCRYNYYRYFGFSVRPVTD